MHDPANLNTILNLVAGFVVAWILFAVLGAFYLGLKWGLRDSASPRREAAPQLPPPASDEDD